MNIFSVEFILASFLIFVRVASVVGTAPFFGSDLFPPRIKIFFAVVLTIMLYPIIPLHGAVIATDITGLELVIAIVQEVLIGVTMGLVGQVIFGGVQLGGQFVSIQIGLAFANIVDPLTQNQNALVSQLLVLFGTVLFLAIEGEKVFLNAMMYSFDVVPIGTANYAAATPIFIDMAKHIFIIGVQIASPFIIVLFLMDLSFAIFARIMPQANIFFIALPLKVLIGMTMLLLVMPNIPMAFNQFFDLMFNYLSDIIDAIGS